MKLTPLPVYPQKLYFTPVMFAYFVCALLSFCGREIPGKYKTENLGKLLWNAPCTL